MSALGHKRTWRQVRAMSAFPPKADIPCREQHVRFVPIGDIAVASYSSRGTFLLLRSLI